MKQALIPIILTATGLAASAAPVDAGHLEHRGNPHRIEVTHGRFETLPHDADGVHYEVKGGAIMFRIADTTAVFVAVSGLAPNTTYPTHVHNQPCSSTPPGGGHYQNTVLGPVDATNEMWPVVTTDDRGRGTGSAFHAFRARPEAQSVVIHYPANTSVRLACVDLS